LSIVEHPEERRGGMPIASKIFTNLYYQANLVETRRIILDFCEPNTEAKLLDCGCSDGEATMEIAERIGVKEVSAIEIVEEDAVKAEERGIKVARADLNQPFPFSSQSFDVVHAANIIEHLYDTDAFLKEVHRVLTVGGYFLVSTCNLAAFHNIFFLLLGRQPPPAHVSDEILVGVWNSKGKPWTEHWRLCGPQHRRMFTLKALEGLLGYYGFQVEKSVGAGFYPLPRLLARVMCKMDKRHSAYITIKARKIASEAIGR
jgi:SAM-dependent methyltransferase